MAISSTETSPLGRKTDEKTDLRPVTERDLQRDDTLVNTLRQGEQSSELCLEFASSSELDSNEPMFEI